MPSHPVWRLGSTGATTMLLLAGVTSDRAGAEIRVPTPETMIVGPLTQIHATQDVVLRPGNDIEAEVRRRPPGTRYLLMAGIYRNQQIFPKDGDSFTGAPGATLNGAHRLATFEAIGKLYVARNQVPHQELERTGVCRPEFPRCAWSQDLYLDDRPLRAVTRLADVRPGTWYFDQRQADVYMGDAPGGHSVELSYVPFAFGGASRNVTVRNLIIEKYASANQQGAINNHGAGVGWTIANNEVRWNHGYGIVVGTADRVLENNVHHNGQLGLGGGSGTHDGLVTGNVIAFNGWNGASYEWECGGAKWGNTSRLTVSGNYVHDNDGTGLWTDEKSWDIVIDSNLIERNRMAGISHEISHAAVIRNNVLRGNGAATHQWAWQAQIQIQNSTDTEVYANTIALDPVKGGNGITVIQQERGIEFRVRNVSIHHNDITMVDAGGVIAGWFAEVGGAGFPDAHNHFDYNRYHIAGGGHHSVWVANKSEVFSDWQQAGWDRNGSVDEDIGPAARR